jgi:uncharacterized protein (TIGR03118 family)
MKRAALFACLITLAPIAPAATGYLVHNLVANTGGTADFTDQNLSTPWGITSSSTGPFWIANGGSGRATVYTADTTGLVLESTVAGIPAHYRQVIAHGDDYTRTICTGIAVNETSGFRIPAGPTNVILAGRGGTLSGWSGTANSINGQLMVDTSPAGWIYLGLVLVPTTSPTPQLFAPNFATGTVDVYDSNWNLVAMPAGSFSDPSIPRGFAPFNIEYLNGKLYVTYAKQSSIFSVGGVSDVPGVGNGYLAVYDVSGRLLQHLISQGPLNSPYGIALAPPTFGPYGGALLVGNSGDGLIHAFDPTSGTLVGTLQDQNRTDIQIPGLHALRVGNGGDAGDTGAIYFTAGPAGQTTGRFGILLAGPVITGNVVNAATPGAEIAPNTFVTIVGTGLSPVTRSWQASDFSGSNLPTSLSGVTVTINGVPAYPTYISPGQINVLTPAGLQLSASAAVVVSDNGLTNLAQGVQTSPFGPAFFLLGGKYAVAQHADGTLVGAATLVPNNSTPAASGETIALFATGLGNTVPAFPQGQIVTATLQLAAPATVTIGGVPANVSFAGLVQAGVYQVNATVPASAPSGDNAVTVQVGGYTSPGGVFLTVR